MAVGYLGLRGAGGNKNTLLGNMDKVSFLCLRKEPKAISMTFIVSFMRVDFSFTDINVSGSYVVLHYSEGTLMPILVNKLIYSLVPTYAPWFIRWFVSMIFKQVTQLVVEPELEKNIKMV
jgi:hypothetical protein